MTMITIPSKDGKSFSAYLAQSAKMPAPVVIVIQEIFGVTDELKAKCDTLAKEGFIAVCPDLFWRLEPGLNLNSTVDADRAKAFDLFSKFDVNKGIDDLRAVMHTFKSHADSNGKMGCVGYCLGGKLAFLMACRAPLDASVSYYGVGLDQLLGEASSIKGKLMLHIAEGDKFVSPAAQQVIKEGLKDNKHVAIHSYAGVDHAFSREGGDSYDEKASALAYERTITFFRSNLR